MAAPATAEPSPDVQLVRQQRHARVVGVSGVVALANALRWLPSQAEPGYLNDVFPLGLVPPLRATVG